jgi:molybdopterin-synthase adenylyltransferase
LSHSKDKAGTVRGAVAVVGVGALGGAAALELAAAGVERILLVDGDRVEISNLHRQLLTSADDVGKPKTEVAARKLSELHPGVTIETCCGRLDAEGAARVLDGYDFVIDATDDPATKFLLNDWCVRAGVPLSYAGVVALGGQMMTIVPGESTCLRCLFPEAPDEADVPTCRQAGILGPLAGILGALQAREAVKALTGRGELLTDRLLTIDAETLATRIALLRRSPACPVCAPRAHVEKEGDRIS